MPKMLHTVTTINGKFVKRGDDKISVFDNSLLYADGIFETFLAVNDNIIFMNEHLKRLYKGTKVMGLTLPIDKATLIKWMVKTVKAHPDSITKLRLTFTSGEAVRWVGIQGKPQVVLSASPHTMLTKPFTVDVSEFRIDQDSEFRRIKTISYAIHAVALKRAKKRKCDDALMLNGKDQIAEVTSANIFWLKKNKIYTPPLTAGCLEGITRKILIHEAKKIGYTIIEKNGTLETLLKADEVFITSSLKFVIPISRIKIGGKMLEIAQEQLASTLYTRFEKLAGLK